MTQNNYIMARGQLDTDKAGMTNYAQVSSLMDSVLAARRNISGDLTDQQAQDIANKTGATIDEVKNPNLIAQQRPQYTAEYAQKMGITS